MYDAWGNLISSTGETENSYLYCGEQLDSTTGLYYLRARYMNPATGTFITQDTYAGTIFDPTSLHKYLYANANPVMNVDLSGYSAENDIDFYKQAWLTIDQALEYESKLICSMHNEVSYDANAMQIGKEILHQLKNTGLEYALTSLLEPYVGPDAARLIANGIVSALDMALSSRNKAVSDKCGITNNAENEKYYRAMKQEDYDYLQLTGEVKATGETFISPTKSFSEDYDGVLVEFTTNPGTKSALEQIGVRDNSNLTGIFYPNMPGVSSVEGWTINNAYFKGEGTQINIGLGKGAGLETFNINIIGFKRLN